MCVTVLAFANNGRSLACGGNDNLVHLWDLATGQEVHRFTGQLGPIAALAFSPDDRTLASASDDTSVLLWDLRDRAAVKSRPKAIPRASDLAEAWAALARPDAVPAYRAMQLLMRSDQSVSFLRPQLRPAAPVDPERVRRLVVDLNNDAFDIRERAEKELRRLGDVAAEELQRAVSAPAELRRRATGLLEALDKPVADPETLRAIRVVEVLEHLGTPQACDLLQTLARGAPAARLTREVKQALARLERWRLPK